MLRILTVLLALSLSACALTTDYIDAPYVPLGPAVPVAGASAVTVSVAAKDARTTYRDRVGSKKNGYGTEMAPIVANNDVIETTRAAIESELAKRGFVVAPGGTVVSVDVNRFYNDFKTGFFAGDSIAEIAVTVKVVGVDKSLLFTQHYEATGKEPNIQVMAGHNARAALSDALKASAHPAGSGPQLGMIFSPVDDVWGS
jgi:uncharacterized lipoprotein YajG